MKRTYSLDDPYPVLIDNIGYNVLPVYSEERQKQIDEESKATQRRLNMKLATIKYRYAMVRGDIVDPQINWNDEVFVEPDLNAFRADLKEFIGSLYAVVGSVMYKDYTVVRSLTTNFFTFECFESSKNILSVIVKFAFGGYMDSAIYKYNMARLRPNVFTYAPIIREYNVFNFIHPDVLCIIINGFFEDNELLSMMISFSGCAADIYLWNSLISCCNNYFFTKNFMFDSTSRDVMAYKVTGMLLKECDAISQLTQ